MTNKTAQEYVLEQLQKRSMTVRELREVIPVHYDTVKSAVNKLKYSELIHIADYDYIPSCHQHLPVYSLGGGTDALHPTQKRALNDNMMLLSKALFSSNYNPFVRDTYAIS